jgi:tRNA pseudouridine38-40 synthase
MDPTIQPKRRIKLLLSYDGTPFLGWQRQVASSLTIQGEVEKVLSKIYDQPVSVVGSGRTDAGTHAVAQVAHFDAPKELATERKLVRALNGLLPETIVVRGAWQAPPEFHALFSVRRKTYIYRIWNHRLRPVLWRQRAYWVENPLDMKVLNNFSKMLLGEHDFKTFQTGGTPVPNTVRRLDTVEWTLKSPHLLEFRIAGQGFLKQMVRNIVGLQLYLERNGGSEAEFKRIFESRDRREAKDTAPAHGLYLYRVEYPPELDKKCLKL